MNIQDAVPDREELRGNAVRRTRRVWWLVAAVIVVSGLLIPLAVLISVNGSLSGAAFVLLLIPVVVGVALGVCLTWLIRRRDGGPALLAGADGSTRRAVRQALRTARPSDARVDALARESADRTVRNSWLLWLYGVLLLLNLGLLILKIGNSGSWQVALAAATSALWAGVLAAFWLTVRRSRNYLRRDDRRSLG
jgi:hypothetical protein